MSGLRSYRNLLAPPTVIRARNPEKCPSGVDPGVKSFPMIPQTWLYTAWAADYTLTNAEFNIDSIGAAETMCIQPKAHNR